MNRNDQKILFSLHVHLGLQTFSLEISSQVHEANQSHSINIVCVQFKSNLCTFVIFSICNV